MAWTFGGVTIHPPGGDFQGSVQSHYATQEVLDATSETLNFWGATSDHLNLGFALDEVVNGNTGLDTLKAAVRADANVALAGDQGSEGNFRILELSWTRAQDHSRTVPFYHCKAQLIKV